MGKRVALTDCVSLDAEQEKLLERLQSRVKRQGIM